MEKAREGRAEAWQQNARPTSRCGDGKMIPRDGLGALTGAQGAAALLLFAALWFALVAAEAVLR